MVYLHGVVTGLPIMKDLKGIALHVLSGVKPLCPFPHIHHLSTSLPQLLQYVKQYMQLKLQKNMI
jgi:hypothetical protein